MEILTFYIYGTKLSSVPILRVKQVKGIRWHRDVVPAIGRLVKKLRGEENLWQRTAPWYVEAVSAGQPSSAIGYEEKFWKETKFPRFIYNHNKRQFIPVPKRKEKK